MSTATRTLDGIQLPAAGTYSLDPSHSHVGFTARHLVVAKVRGRFGAFSGSVVVAEDPLASSVSVEIDVASIDTRDEGRDGHLKSADFFDVERFPSITFRSTGVRPAGRGRFAVDGDLTVRGVTRPVVLDVVLEGVASDPWGGQRAVFSATTEIDREDFGLTWNQALETGGVLVGNRIKVEIEAEAVLQ
jgi:polyisoprenoid-binding protein YceI